MTVLMWLMLSVVKAESMQTLVLASDSNSTVEAREAAFAEIVRSGSTEIQYLIDVAGDTTQSTRLRWVAIRALGQIRGPQAETVLIKTLNDPEPAIRTATVSALGDFGKVEYTALIGRFLKDDAVIVRVAAAESLGKLGDAKAIAMLEAALDDPSNQYRGASLWVRAHYTMALGNIGDAKAYPVLLECLADGDTRVVQSAVVSLEKIAGFSLGDGRSSTEEVEAWSRWVQNQLK